MHDVSVVQWTPDDGSLRARRPGCETIAFARAMCRPWPEQTMLKLRPETRQLSHPRALRHRCRSRARGEPT